VTAQIDRGEQRLDQDTSGHIRATKYKDRARTCLLVCVSACNCLLSGLQTGAEPIVPFISLARALLYLPAVISQSQPIDLTIPVPNSSISISSLCQATPDYRPPCRPYLSLPHHSRSNGGSCLFISTICLRQTTTGYGFPALQDPGILDTTYFRFTSSPRLQRHNIPSTACSSWLAHI